MILLQLFWTFFLIGLFNFGGGGAMIALIQSQVVHVHGWITEDMFADIVAISQSTPGPIGINCATFVGYEVGGFIGSFIATFSVVLPSFLLFFILVKLFSRFHENIYFTNVMKVLKPAVSGLIAAAAVILTIHISPDGIEIISENFPDWISWILFAISLIASLFTKVNPIYLIIGAGIIGVFLY